MKRLVLAGAVLGAGAGVWMLNRGRATSGSTATVFHRERADGVDERLQQFLDEWANGGPFDLVVLVDGGLRTDEAKQEQLYADGKSNAPTLAETPHGRGGAIDVARRGPLGVVDWNAWEDFAAIGRFAKGLGLRWGGDFSSIKDGPHIEVPNWRDLPIPGGVA